jgi:hypothetical protein
MEWVRWLKPQEIAKRFLRAEREEKEVHVVSDKIEKSIKGKMQNL